MALSLIPALATAAAGYFGYKSQKDSNKEAINAQAAADAANRAQQQAAMDMENKWNQASLDWQKEMFNRGLADSQSNQANQMSLARLGSAGQLMGQQMGLDQMIQLMQMQQAEQRPMNMARQSAIQQAIPSLMALAGLNPVSVGNGYTEANPQALGRNLLSELGQYNSALAPMLGQQQTGQPQAVGQPMQQGQVAGQQQAQMGGQAMSQTTPWSNANVDVNKLLTMSPVAQFQMKQAEDAIRRSLAARGGLNSSEFTAQMGTMGGNIASAEAQNAQKRLWDLVNFGQGGQAPSSSWQTPNVSLSNIGQDMSSALNSAANTRQGLYSGMGSNIGQSMAGYGQAASNSMSNMGNLGFAAAAQRNNMQASQPNFLTSLAQTGNQIGSLANTYNSLNGMFNPSSKSGSNNSGGWMTSLYNMFK